MMYSDLHYIPVAMAGQQHHDGCVSLSMRDRSALSRLSGMWMNRVQVCPSWKCLSVAVTENEGYPSHLCSFENQEIHLRNSRCNLTDSWPPESVVCLLHILGMA
jgi:hypothetical protein